MADGPVRAVCASQFHANSSSAAHPSAAPFAFAGSHTSKAEGRAGLAHWGAAGLPGCLDARVGWVTSAPSATQQQQHSIPS